MALRNCDLDSVVRGVLEGSRDDAKAIAELAAAKLKECGCKADGGAAVKALPRHAGRRNPLAGRVKGSGDLNLRGVIDWIGSIEPAPAGEELSDETKAALAALVTVHATAAAHSA